MPTRITIEQLNEYFKDVGDVIVSEKYVCGKKVKILCNRCKQIYEKSAQDIKQGRKCTSCDAKEGKCNIQLTNKYVAKYIADKGDKLKSKYVRASHKIEIECKNGHNISMTWNNYMRGKNCKYCTNEKLSRERRYPIGYIKNYVENRGDKFIHSNYINQKSPIEFECGKCGKKSVKMFISYVKCGCRDCGPVSKGEKTISEYLNNIGISYITEAKFKDCAYKKCLPFDFHIPELNLCIEFDGIQHYQPVEKFDGQKGFELTKKRDEIKNKYCADNNIRLIRIAYFDIDNIKTILDKLLLQYIIDDLVNSD